MNKNILHIIAVFMFFIWAKWLSSDELRPELYGISIGIAFTLLIKFLIFLYDERSFLKLYLNSMILKPNAEIRLSIAYLFRIECRGKYLLVKNSRFDKVTYQPVGGVYKYFHPEATATLNSLNIITDNAIENDDKSEHDMRLKMTKRKHLKKFIDWLFSAKERELDPWREFHEELVATDILPKKHFNFIYYKLAGQDFEPIHLDEYYKVDTFKYVDIFTPRYVNQVQRDEIEKLLLKECDDFIWVTEEEIKKKFSNDGRRISDHAHKIFLTKKLQ